MNSFDESNETFNLSPIRKSRNNAQNDKTFEDTNSFSQNETILTQKYYTSTVIRPLYRPTVCDSKIPKCIKIDIAKGDSGKTETIQLRDDEYLSSSKVSRISKNQTYLPQEGFKDLLKYENFREEILPESENHSISNPKYSQSNYSSSTKEKQRNDLLTPDLSQKHIPKGYKISHKYKKSQSMSNFNSQTISNSSRVKSRIRRYGKNKNERETSLRFVSTPSLSHTSTLSLVHQYKEQK